MIESCYDDMSYNDLKTKIDSKLKDISKILEKWLNIKLDELKIVTMF